MKKVKVAVIGAGHLGKIHARIYSECPNAELIGICDTDEEKARAHAETFSTQPFFDYHELFNKVEAVSIATPTFSHYKIGKDFLNHKVHVMMEKPITAIISEAERLIALAKKNKKILQVGHVERFNPAIKTIQRFCKNPRFIECHRLSPYPKRGTDVSVVLDLMIHDIDIILSFVESGLKNIEAIGVPVLSACEDIANARLTFKNGIVCNLTASRISGGVLRKIRIFQKNCYISLDYAAQKVTIYRKKGSLIAKKELVVLKKEPLVEELNSFIQCIQQGKQPVVCGRDAKEALEIATLITKKIRKNY